MQTLSSEAAMVREHTGKRSTFRLAKRGDVQS